MKFKIEQSSEKINSAGGMTLVGALLDKARLNKAVDTIQTGKGRTIYSNSSIIRGYLGLLCQGRTSYDDLILFKNNEFYADSLNINGLASVERLRQRLDEGAGVFDASIRRVNLALLSKQTFGRVKTQFGSYISWDCDVSPLDNSRTKKENVSRTYKDYDGYAPMFGYLGREGFMLDCELRPGKQHCQSGTVEFLKLLPEKSTKQEIIFCFLNWKLIRIGQVCVRMQRKSSDYTMITVPVSNSTVS